MSPILDLAVTLLTLGRNGLATLLQQREDVATILQERLTAAATAAGLRLLVSPANPISFAITLIPHQQRNEADDTGEASPGDAARAAATTYVGSMLFVRGISGTRVVSGVEETVVAGQRFAGYGASVDKYANAPYMTAAASLGLTGADVDRFVDRLQGVLHDTRNRAPRRNVAGELTLACSSISNATR